MVPSSRLRSTAIVAATLLVTGCDDLLPGRRQSPVAVVAASDSSPAKSRRGARPDSAARAATGPEAEAAFRDISQSLRRLVAAEQAFFAENGTYGADLERVGFRPRGASQVEFLWITKEGWAARATHPALPGRDCVTYTGVGGPVPATRRLGRTGREGVVVCDFVMPPQPVRRPVPPPGAPARTPAAPAPAPLVVDTTSALDAVNPVVQMRVDLRKLAQAQTAYFGTQGAYSRRVETLPLQFGWQRGVSVRLLHADGYSWSARATHEARPGKSCVVWYGRPPRRPATEAQQRVPQRSGVPVCDD
jgi:hypothetical protein